MSSVPPEIRRAPLKYDERGPYHEWTLTSSKLTDLVELVVPPRCVLPVIFVPGIMGSNLRMKKGTEPVWRLDTALGDRPLNLVRKFVNADEGKRQLLLHPDRVEVDPDGAVPERVDTIGDKDALRKRGWGTVGEGSYQDFLIWLEQKLNPPERNPARWRDYYQDQATIGAPLKPGEEPRLFPGIRMGVAGQPFGAEKSFDSLTTDDLLKRAKFWMPVYACGYNWLDSNKVAAQSTLAPLIDKLIAQYHNRSLDCAQVILVTHSMGGLVARACSELRGMQDKIAGIVHGVMPSIGAAVAYRRCKVGMRDEDFWASLVMGRTGKAVTAVFAQAPGALQLLPTQDYSPSWLRIVEGKQALKSYPATDPYSDIYLCRDKWWGLVNEEWLAPVGGVPIKWPKFSANVAKAKEFHQEISGKYHPNTYVYYGADAKQASFQNITWRLKPGLSPGKGTGPSAAQVPELDKGAVRLSGSTPAYVGGETVVQSYSMPYGGDGVRYLETSFWELHCDKQDGVGDGTVPETSGANPKALGGANIKQQFRLTGFDHEGSYRDSIMARNATLYAISRIAGQAKLPQ